MPSIYPDSGPRAGSFVCMVTRINRRDRILWRYLFVWAYPVDRVLARSTICPIAICLNFGWATMCREETRGDLWLLRSTMRLGSESRRGSVWYGWRKKKTLLKQMFIIAVFSVLLFFTFSWEVILKYMGNFVFAVVFKNHTDVLIFYFHKLCNRNRVVTEIQFSNSNKSS